MVAEMIERIKADAHDDAAWLDAFLGIVAERQIGIEDFLTARHRLRGDAGTFAYDATLRLPARGAGWLAQNVRRESAFRGIFLFLAGLERAGALDLDGCLPMLREGAFLGLHCMKTVFTTDPGFEDIAMRMLQQSALLESSHYAPAARLPPPVVETIAPPQRRAAGGPLVLACCDDGYFRSYARRFAETLQAACPRATATIHLINPAAGTQSLIDGLRTSFPLLGVTQEQGPETPSYYASSRFLIAGRMLDILPGGLILTDIDSVFRPGASEILDESGRHSVAIIRKADEVQPNLVFDAALVGIGDDPCGRAFLCDTADYLAHKLAEAVPLWTIDQIALFRAVCLSTARGEGPFDLAGHFKATYALPAFIKDDHSTSLLTRIASRVRAIDAITFDEAWRPTFS